MEGSQVARLRESIEAEISSLRMLSTFTFKGSHKVINGKFQRVDEFSDQLEALIGEKATTSYICEAYVQYFQ